MANLRVDKITSTETFETTGSVQFVDADSLQIAANSDFDFGTGDFTVEWWQYMKDEPDEYQTVLSINYATNPNLAIQSASNAGVVAQKVYVNGSSLTFTEESNAPLSTWVHYALVRNGSGLNNLKIYRDGVQTGQGTYTGDIGSSSSINYIGGHPNVASGVDVQGFISNLRIVKGTALYTSNFKPSMRELEVVPGTVLLACQSKTDASLEKTGKTITVNGNAVASELTPGLLTPVVKSGGGSAITGSVEFTGSPSKLTADSVDFAMGSNDLTMECWFYNGVDTITHVLQIDTGTYQSPSDITNFSLATRDAAAGDVRFLIRNDSGSNLSDLVSGAPRAKINAWHHLAGTIEGTTTRLFLNGILIASGTISGTRTHTGQRCTVGANQSTRYLKGYMSNVRIVKGTALYTDSFTPPTRELKRVPGTVLLCCQDENSVTTEVTGKTITSNGDPAPSNFTPQVGDDRQVTFEGVTKINSDAYFYLPTGDTASREATGTYNSGTRGVMMGGIIAGGSTKNATIDYWTMASEGNAVDFGDTAVPVFSLTGLSDSHGGLAE